MSPRKDADRTLKDEEHRAARTTFRRAVLVARVSLSWNEIMRVLAECSVADPDPFPKAACESGGRRTSDGDSD